MNPETINFLFINICSGTNYEKIKKNQNFKQIVKQNKDNKDKVIEVIESFEGKDPMYYTIKKEDKNELCYEKIGNLYTIYEINYEEIIYIDFAGNQIFSHIGKIKKKQKSITLLRIFYIDIREHWDLVQEVF